MSVLNPIPTLWTLHCTALSMRLHWESAGRWHIPHRGLPTTVRTFPSNAQAALLTPTLPYLLQATHGAGTTWGACRNSEVHPGQEQSQSKHYGCAGKPQICCFSEKKITCSLCKDDKSLAAVLGRWWREKEGSLARLQISAKGLRFAPPPRKWKGCG